MNTSFFRSILTITFILSLAITFVDCKKRATPIKMLAEIHKLQKSLKSLSQGISKNKKLKMLPIVLPNGKVIHSIATNPTHQYSYPELTPTPSPTQSHTPSYTTSASVQSSPTMSPSVHTQMPIHPHQMHQVQQLTPNWIVNGEYVPYNGLALNNMSRERNYSRTQEENPETSHVIQQIHNQRQMWRSSTRHSFIQGTQIPVGVTMSRSPSEQSYVAEGGFHPNQSMTYSASPESYIAGTHFVVGRTMSNSPQPQSPQVIHNYSDMPSLPRFTPSPSMSYEQPMTQDQLQRPQLVARDANNPYRMLAQRKRN